MPTEPLLLALGDCNTVGTKGNEPSAYPYLLGRALEVEVLNCGQGMFTIREGVRYARRHLSPRTTYLTIQFGLVDSWLTFRGAPYVLYYPDNAARLVLRKAVKRFKKLGRQLRFHSIFGQKHVVEPSEYRAGLRAIIRQGRAQSPSVHICLIGTPPSLQEHRNPGIQKYNDILRQVANDNGCDFVDTYAPFVGQPGLFEDPVHLTTEGHKIICELCLNTLQKYSRG